MRETLAQSPRRGPVRAARARSSRPSAALAGVLLSYLKVAISRAPAAEVDFTYYFRT